MTVIVLYAVLPAPPPDGMPAATPDGQPLRLHRGHGVSVLFTEQDEPPGAARADVLAFGQVVTEIGRAGPILPMRYGTVLPGASELEPLVADREADWAARLTAVRGHAEMVVHVDTGEATATAPPTDGRSYLLGLVEDRRRRDQVAAELRAAAGDTCRETRVLPPPGLRVACLVDAARIDDFLALLHRWEAAPGEVRATGPWPPFSFTDEPTATAPAGSP